MLGKAIMYFGKESKAMQVKKANFALLFQHNNFSSSNPKRNMKSIFQKTLAFIFVLAMFVAFGFKSPKGEVCIKVKNNTGASVTLHTGKGTTPINNGVEREFCMEEGSELYYANKGLKGKLIVKFTANMHNKKINLKDYPQN